MFSIPGISSWKYFRCFNPWTTTGVYAAIIYNPAKINLVEVVFHRRSPDLSVNIVYYYAGRKIKRRKIRREPKTQTRRWSIYLPRRISNTPRINDPRDCWRYRMKTVATFRYGMQNFLDEQRHVNSQFPHRSLWTSGCLRRESPRLPSKAIYFVKVSSSSG